MYRIPAPAAGLHEKKIKNKKIELLIISWRSLLFFPERK